jgi:Uncharacterized conserved protein
MKRYRKALHFILLLIGIAGLINSIFVCIYSNINVGSIFPGAVGILLIACVVVKTYTKGGPIIKWKSLRYLIILGVVSFTLSFVSIEALIVLNNHSEQDYGTEYLIILGAGIMGERVTLTLQERLNKGIEYLGEHPQTKVIVSGGKGFEETITEAEAMKKYLIERGIEPSRIFMEEKSTSTMENFKYTKALLAEMGYKGRIKIMVITSDFHMMRAKMLARRFGFEPYGITCGTPAIVRANCYFREYFAVIKSYILDVILSSGYQM